MTNEPPDDGEYTEQHYRPDAWAEILARRPTAEEVDNRARDLLGRAHQVQQFGWDDFRYSWSSGEVSGTALLLGDLDVLAAAHDTEQSALETWAANLWGIDGGQADTDNGLERTRGWFYALRQRLNEQGRAGDT